MKELLEEINVTTSSEPENGPSCMMTCGLGTVRGAEQEPSFTLTLVTNITPGEEKVLFCETIQMLSAPACIHMCDTSHKLQEICTLV